MAKGQPNNCPCYTRIVQISETTTDTAYVPGVCNINHAEIVRRRKAGYLGLALFIVILMICVFLISTDWVRLVLFAPAFLGAVGFLQAHYKFCVGYAAAGLQNANEDSETAIAVEAAAKAIDKQRARRINTQSLIIAVIATILSFGIPRL
jgi:hypothetical protein